MSIIANNYLREETFQYMDETTDGQLVDGGKWYFIEIDKLLNTELLQEERINGVAFDADEVELPDGKGICYSGKGVQFEYESRKYNTVDANLSILNQALKS